MFVSYALSGLYIEADQEVHDVIPLNLLWHLSTLHIYYIYEHLA